MRVNISWDKTSLTKLCFANSVQRLWPITISVNVVCIRLEHIRFTLHFKYSEWSTEGIAIIMSAHHAHPLSWVISIARSLVYALSLAGHERMKSSCTLPVASQLSQGSSIYYDQKQNMKSSGFSFCFYLK